MSSLGARARRFTGVLCLLFLTELATLLVLAPASRGPGAGLVLGALRDAAVLTALAGPILWLVLTATFRAEARTRQLNRLLRAAHDINMLLAQEPDRETVLDETARMLGQIGGFEVVCVAWAGADGSVLPKAWFGADASRVAQGPWRWDDEAGGGGLLARTLRSRAVSLSRDLEAEPEGSPCRELSRALGVRAAAAAPIVVDEGSVGVLLLGTSRRDAFRDEEITDLLEQLAADLGRTLAAAQARRDLAENEERLRLMAASATDAILLVDDGGRIVQWDGAAARILGWTREEAVGREVLPLLAPEGSAPASREALRCALEAAATPEASRPVETSARSRAGDAVPVELTAAPVRRAGQTFTLVVLRDIAARLAQQDRMLTLARAVTQSPVSILITDRAGRIEYVNPHFCAVSGYTEAEVLGRNPRFLKSGRQPPEFYDSLWRTLAEGREWRGEFLNRRKDGALYWESASISPVAGTGPLGGHLVCVKEDITERKRLEERYRLLVDNIQDGILLRDVEGSVLFANDRCRALLGRPRGEPGLLPLEEAAAPEHRALLRERQERQRRGEPVPARFEFLAAPDGGAARWIEVDEVEVRDHAGRIAGVQAVLRDVTERRSAAEALRRTEEQLRHAQKMEALGRMAGGIAHDFNNLLVVISGQAELALLRGVADPALRRALEEIRGAGARAAQLTAQLLAFARRQVVEQQVLDPNAAITGVQGLLRRLAGEGVDLRLELGADAGPVRLGQGQFEQILMNLVMNARDAMPQGGRLTIATARHEGSDPAEGPAGEPPGPGPWTVLRVADAGVGMDEAVLAQIFEPFFTTKGPGQGTGLGLSTVHGVVTQAGGRVGVTSRVGVGTEFRIYLPVVAHEAPQAPSAEPPGAPAAAAGETVLLVEDDPAVRALLTGYLRDQGYRVLEACDGAQAISLCHGTSDPIDVLVSDVVMPKLNGVELAEHLRAARPGLALLLMSGYAGERLAASGNLPRAVHFLPKPFPPAALARRIREVLAARGRT